MRRWPPPGNLPDQGGAGGSWSPSHDPQAYQELTSSLPQKRKEREGDINEAIRLLEGSWRSGDQGADHRPSKHF